MTLYPIISTVYNEKHQSKIHTQYEEQVKQVDDSAIIKAKELAIAYNEAIQPGAQLSDAFSNEALLWASEDYKNQLNVTGNGIMGYVNIPSINVHLPSTMHRDKDPGKRHRSLAWQFSASGRRYYA